MRAGSPGGPTKRRMDHEAYDSSRKLGIRGCYSLNHAITDGKTKHKHEVRGTSEIQSWLGRYLIFKGQAGQSGSVGLLPVSSRLSFACGCPTNQKGPVQQQEGKREKGQNETTTPKSRTKALNHVKQL